MASLPAPTVRDLPEPPKNLWRIVGPGIVAAGVGQSSGEFVCQSNWIRDKGFGMGQYVPRLVSPVTGAEEAAPGRVSYVFEPTVANMVARDGAPCEDCW